MSLHMSLHVITTPNESYWYLKIILLDQFVLNIAEISIHFNSNYLRCFCVDVRLQNKNKQKQNQNQIAVLKYFSKTLCILFPSNRMKPFSKSNC